MPDVALDGTGTDTKDDTETTVESETQAAAAGGDDIDPSMSADTTAATPPAGVNLSQVELVCNPDGSFHSYRTL